MRLDSHGLLWDADGVVCSRHGCFWRKSRHDHCDGDLLDLAKEHLRAHGVPVD